MNKIYLTALLISFGSGVMAQQKQPAATVYTTAEGSDLKISKTGNLTFSDMKQPLETQVCIFVDPRKTFQTLVGIGGAITDATAETYAKLPKTAQQEFLKAYYDKENGIGFSLARTNIHSTDFSSDSYT